MKTVNVGIIGTGMIGRSAHIKGLLACPEARIVALCDIDPKALSLAAERAGVPKEKCYTDYRDLIADSDVDAVEICTPNHLHCEMARAVLAAGKHLNLEKPMAMSCDEASSIVELEKTKGTVNMISFSYRFTPAVRYAKHLIDSGAIGKVVGLNVAYLKCSGYWKGRRLEWRFDKKLAGSGVSGDFGTHLIDMAQLLAGNIIELCATTSIVVKERLTLDGSEFAPVTTDDSCSFIARFSSGAEGSFHISRCAIGNSNTIRYDVYGEKGSFSFNLNERSSLTVCYGEGDPKLLKPEKITVPEEFSLPQERAFINAICGNRDPLFPTLSDGFQGQSVLDAILASAEKKCWVKV